MDHLFSAAVIILIVNIPFGYWRAGTKKFTTAWFGAVHLPIPVVVATRLFFGLGLHLTTFPIFVGAYFTGQMLGGKLRPSFGLQKTS